MVSEAELRRTYMAHEGALLHSDAGRAMARSLAEQVPMRLESAPIPDSDDMSAHPNFEALGSAFLALFGLRARVHGELRSDFRLSRVSQSFSRNRERFDHYGCQVSDEDLQHGMANAKYSHGFDDPEFSIDFSTWSAHTILMLFLESKKGARQQLASKIGLVDYADIISTGWFSDAMHRLAAAHFGVWNITGQEQSHFFGKKAINNLDGKQVFELVHAPEKEEYENYQGLLIAQPTRAVLIMLRQKLLEAKDSSGCPAARKGIVIEKTEEGNHHVQRLVTLGEAVLKPLSLSPDKLLLHQNETAIDHMLLAWAHYLRKYVTMYGEPRADVKGNITHRPASSPQLEEYFVI